MPSRLPVGPYRQVNLQDGSQCPFYIIPFDKNGSCIGPQTKQHLIESISQGQFTDIFLFSHGWNNDWTVATTRYENFLSGYMKMRQEHELPVPTGYRPLLVGIYWPSTALVFTETEKGPAIAAGDPDAFDQAVSYYAQVLGPPAYVEGAGTRGWPIGSGWLTLLRGTSGNPRNVEVTFRVETVQEAERLQRAFIEAGGTGQEPSDQLMYEPVRFCPVRDPFGTDLLVISPSS